MYTEAEREVLSHFFTNTTQNVFALKNMPEVVKAALFARYSRTHKPLRRLFLDEFAQDIKLNPESFVGLDRATGLFDKVFVDYGDDSVAQLGGAHLAIEQTSNICTKAIEWGRLASYLEQSTRYIFFDKKLNGQYRYFTPPEITRAGLEPQYRGLVDSLFDLYKVMISPLTQYHESLNPLGELNPKAYKAAIRARVCDDLRGLLPASTTSNLGVYASGQAYENMLIRMFSSPLEEVRACAEEMLNELNQVTPSFMKRVRREDRGVEWSQYLSNIRDKMQGEAEDLGVRSTQLSFPYANSQSSVRLIDYHGSETALVEACLFAYSSYSSKTIELSESDRDVLVSYAGDRKNRRHKPGRAFETVGYRFEIESDYGAFRDLQRHRMANIEWQPLTPYIGYTTPTSVRDCGLERRWDSAMGKMAEFYNLLYSRLEIKEAAQYVLPLAYKLRYIMDFNAREAFHILELRTQPGGHETYREICQKMHKDIKEVHPHVADLMKFVNHNSYTIGRIE